MNALICLFVIVATAAANDVKVSQDTLGNYKVLYNIDDISREEIGTQDGTVKGSYSYVDLDGHKHQISYTSGIEGFIAKGASIPVPVSDLPEVELARMEHLRNYNEILKTLPITEEFKSEGQWVEAPSSRILNLNTIVPLVRYARVPL